MRLTYGRAMSIIAEFESFDTCYAHLNRYPRVCCATRYDTVVASRCAAYPTVPQRSDHPTVQRGGGVSTKEAIQHERDHPRTPARRARRAHGPALEAATAPRRQAGGGWRPQAVSVSRGCVLCDVESMTPSRGADPTSRGRYNLRTSAGADSICPWRSLVRKRTGVRFP